MIVLVSLIVWFFLGWPVSRSLGWFYGKTESSNTTLLTIGFYLSIIVAAPFIIATWLYYFVVYGIPKT